ncbi:MAG: FAD-binding protein [Catonella sp.]|uniref:FAD-binding protein n=1 Tax=Catonella sp. TaxID=2382125 RepID=UPI003FA10F8D
MNIIGAGLAGLSASISLAKQGISCNLISNLPSERAQSVMAEGGINGAINTMGEDDDTEYHFEDTMKAGGEIADKAMVRGLVETAPDIIRYLQSIGVPFNLKNNEIRQRNFGGQKKKRTAYAKSSTGKVIMTALIDEARKYEVLGLIKRYSNHEFLSLRLENNICKGVEVRNNYTGVCYYFEGRVILASGGLSGIFRGLTTGSTANTGFVTAKVFEQGVRLSNLEMIQYHPTTIKIADKACLVSEAARGEGGRLFIYKNNEKWYFMEEKYPELKNLMPRDVVSREMYFVSRGNDAQVYLDMTELSKEVWKDRLPDLREEIIHYLGKDPKTEPIPVAPGIHYFMGGIDVDRNHSTNIENLFAAGECCSAYHGANRLGGNSLLGAIYGGRCAAKTVARLEKEGKTDFGEIIKPQVIAVDKENDKAWLENNEESFTIKVRDILFETMGIVRSEQGLNKGLLQLEELTKEPLNKEEIARINLARAMILSSLYRKESRGANFREDYPERNDAYKGMTRVILQGNKIDIGIWRADEDTN